MKYIHIRRHLARIEIILDKGRDFKIVGVHDNYRCLNDDTAQWLECDLWSKYRTSFRKKIGSNKFNAGAFKYHISGSNNIVHVVLFKVPHGCKI